MRPVGLILVAVVLAAGCDAGELNPDLDLNGAWPPGDTLGEDPSPWCNEICSRIDVCYATRSDIRSACRANCPSSGVNGSSCAGCLAALSCSAIEIGTCYGACSGIQNLSCGPGWSTSYSNCESMGCVCRPSCTFAGSLSGECNTGCCLNNVCLPQCACAGSLSPSGC